MNVKIKKLTDSAKIPTKANETDAGYDLYADNSEEIIISPGSMYKIHTGIALSAPHGYFGAIFARSGMAIKRGGRPANCVGVVDESYTGEVIVGLYNDSQENLIIEPHERVAQMIFLPYLNVDFIEVEKLEETDRGERGFGSSGQF